MPRGIKTLWMGLLLALGVRLVLVAVGPTQTPRTDDMVVYYSESLKLAESPTAWIQKGTEFGYRAPLYFLYLAGLRHLCPGSGYRLAETCTLVLGLFTSLLAYWIATSLEGPSAGLAAFHMRAFLPFFVIADTFVLTEPLFSTLLLAATLTFLAFARNRRWKYPSLIGVLIGLCLLTKESATGYPLIFGGAIVAMGGSINIRMKRVLLFLGAMTITLVPWMYRNWLVWGRPLPLSQTSGVNLFIGNNPDATGLWGPVRKNPPPGVGFGTPEANEWFLKQAMLYITDYPRGFLLHGLKKLAWLSFPSFHRDRIIQSGYRMSQLMITCLALLCGVTSALFILLGVTGFILHKRDLFWRLAASLMGYQLAVTFVVFAHPRLRDPVDHLLLFYAASGVANWKEFWRQARASLSAYSWKGFALIASYALILIGWATIALTKALSPSY